MPKSIRQALHEQKEGFYIGHRIVLPFRCMLIKVIVDGLIFTEMVGSKHIKIQQDPKNTSIYIRSIGKLGNFVDTYKVIKLIACEWDADISDRSTHIKLVCEIRDNHTVTIHQPTDDMLFIE